MPALRIDELALHRENAFVIPCFDFLGAAAALADIAFKAPFETKSGFGVDEHGELKVAAQGSAMEKPEPFENDHVARFEKSFADVARVRGKIVFRNATYSAARDVREAFAESGPVESFRIVKIDFAALSGSEMREVFVKTILADETGFIGTERAHEAFGEPRFTAPTPADNPDDHGASFYICMLRGDPHFRSPV